MLFRRRPDSQRTRRHDGLIGYGFYQATSKSPSAEYPGRSPSRRTRGIGSLMSPDMRHQLKDHVSYWRSTQFLEVQNDLGRFNSLILKRRGGRQSLASTPGSVRCVKHHHSCPRTGGDCGMSFSRAMICVASNTYARWKIGGRVWGVVEVGKLISVVTGSLKNGISVYETLWTGQVRQGAIYTSQAVQGPVQPFIRGICAGSPSASADGI